MEIPSSSQPVVVRTVRTLPPHACILALCTEMVRTATVAILDPLPASICARWKMIERTEFISFANDAYPSNWLRILASAKAHAAPY